MKKLSKVLSLVVPIAIVLISNCSGIENPATTCKKNEVALSYLVSNSNKQVLQDSTTSNKLSEITYNVQVDTNVIKSNPDSNYSLVISYPNIPLSKSIEVNGSYLVDGKANLTVSDTENNVTKGQQALVTIKSNNQTFTSYVEINSDNPKVTVNYITTNKAMILKAQNMYSEKMSSLGVSTLTEEQIDNYVANTEIIVNALKNQPVTNT